jgi:hypothetical protein
VIMPAGGEIKRLPLEDEGSVCLRSDKPEGWFTHITRLA